MPPRTTHKGESKQGLIITLVFFILATIGLGVATYYGFAEQDALTKKAKEEKTTADAFKNERDYYKAQAKVFRSYLGQAQTLDGVDTLEAEKKQLESGGMIKGFTAKDKDDVLKVLKTLEAKYKWNGNQPVETAESAYNALNAQYETLAKKNQNLTAERDKAKKEVEEKEKELLAAREDFKKALDDMAKKHDEAFAKADQSRQEALKASNTFQTTFDQEMKAKTAEKEALVKKIGEKDQQIADLRKNLAKKEQEIDQFKTDHPVAPASMRTDWRIVRMDPEGTHPYINLGSSDRVHPQLTFTVHGVGVDGRPNPQAKATLEVVRVIGPHLSQTRVTSAKDRNRDPIVERDVIYNPSWDPNLKKHVAISGIVDLTGDGRDSLKEFMRSLERQNIVVDAYQDPKDNSMKGRITFRTDYLIVGEPPDSSGDNKATKAREEAATGRKHMEDEAKKYGVQAISLPRYLDMIGYRRPHSMRMQAPTLYNPELRPDQEPRRNDKTPPPMKEDK
jgi:chemotaxis protein histidine kinase CheA